MKPKVVMRGVGGMTVWAVPDSKLEIMWSGPGASLLIGQPRVVGGSVSLIRHHTASGPFHSLKDAESAVAAFITAES